MKDRPGWQNEEVFDSGDAFFKALERDVAQSRHSVDLESYIFENDELGSRVLASLEAAAKRGIRVRLLVDGFGSPLFSGTVVDELCAKGIEARVYHPFSISRNFFQDLNHRNHRKVCIIDGRIAFAGGMNVSAKHLAQYSGAEAWRDTAVRVEGDDVNMLAAAFDSAYWGRRPKRSLSPHVRLNDTWRKRRRTYRDLVRRIGAAEKRVWITTPYFVPEWRLLRALAQAAMTGKDVRLLLPLQSDLNFMRWANRAYYSFLLGFGARIYEYLPGILHAKTVLIDRWVTVGSSNMNHRSIFHDLEVDLVLGQDESIRKLEGCFLTDLERSREIKPETWERRHWVKRLFQRMMQELVGFVRSWL